MKGDLRNVSRKLEENKLEGVERRGKEKSKNRDFFLLNWGIVALRWARSLGQEDALEKGMATHSSILFWRIHGQRSQAGYVCGDRKESDTPE